MKLRESGGSYRSVSIPLRRPAAVMVVVGGLIVLALGLLFSGGRAPRGIDAWSERRDPPRPPAQTVAGAVDSLGDPVTAAVLVLAAASICLFLRRPVTAVLQVVGVASTIVVTEVGKELVGRTIHGPNLSFPSGHTSFATALAMVLAMLFADVFGLQGRAAVAVVLGAALGAGVMMGLSQVVLNVHFPTDAVGGIATALAVVPATGRGLDALAGRLWR